LSNQYLADGWIFIALNNQIQMENQNNQLQKQAKMEVAFVNKQSMNLCVAMEAGNNREITHILKQYKDQAGLVKFDEVMKVPLSDRLPAIVEKNYMKATALVVAAITMAFEKMSMKKKVDGVLINNIADEVIDTCGEDNLGLEDLMLFLQGLVRGKYGNYDDMTVAKFMNLFELYRDERHKAIILHRENEAAYLDSLGDPSDRIKANTLLDEQLASYASRLQEKNDELKLLRREAKEKK
jgi:hypothetical protein